MNLRKNFHPQEYNTVIDYHATLRKNELRVNRVSGLIALFVLVISVILAVLNYAGIYSLDRTQTFKYVLFLMPFCLSSFLLADVFKVDKAWVKYVILANDCIIVLLQYSFFSMNVVLLFTLPLLKSCLYFDNKMTAYTCVLSIIAMFFSHILCVDFSISIDDPLISDYHTSIVFGFIPRLIEYLLICIVVAYLSTSSSSMMASLYSVASKNEKLVRDMRDTQYEIVNNLATISDNKSPETGDHIGRVFDYMNVLAKKSGYSDREAYDIALASMLHDIGKLCVDENIITAPRELTPEEFDKMKQHVVYGRDLLANSPNKVIQMGSDIAYQHHENYDGTGYLGLKGDEISYFARMMSVVDVFDALTSKRSYKGAWSKKDALKELIRRKGTKFDPKVVDLFVDSFEDISRICDSQNPDPH